MDPIGTRGEDRQRRGGGGGDIPKTMRTGPGTPGEAQWTPSDPWGQTDGGGEEGGVGIPPTTRMEGPGTPWGDQGTLVAGESGATLDTTALVGGRPPSDTAWKQHTSPPLTSGGG